MATDTPTDPQPTLTPSAIALDAWMRGDGPRIRTLARALNVTENAIRSWRDGRTRPRPGTREALERVSEGAVPAATWLTAREARWAHLVAPGDEGRPDTPPALAEPVAGMATAPDTTPVTGTPVPVLLSPVILGPADEEILCACLHLGRAHLRPEWVGQWERTVEKLRSIGLPLLPPADNPG